MTELKEGIKPPKPAAKKEHPELRIRLMEIKDADGKSMVGAETDLRRFAEKGGKKCTIKFELQNQPALGRIDIEPDPGSSVAKKYYGANPAWTHFDSLDAGQHTIEWDGRADIDGKRLLIQGEYKVKLWAACPLCGKEYTDEKTFKVKKPYGDAYGSIYPASYHEPRNFTPPATSFRSAIASLSDGSGFECAGSVIANAHDALKRMKDYSAVWFCNAHARPGLVVFFDRPLDANKTRIVTDVSVSPDLATAHLAQVDAIAAGALNNVFLVVLMGCETAKTPSLPQALVNKGVDLVIAFQEKVYISLIHPWTKAFAAALDAGESIGQAVTTATNKAPAADRKVLAHRITGGGGGNPKDTFLPARYGRKK